MAKKFTLEKEVEYKNGQVNTWYIIKLKDTVTGTLEFIDSCRDDETRAYELLEAAINNYVPTSTTIIKEVTID